jgi:hypothetical protein
LKTLAEIDSRLEALIAQPPDRSDAEEMLGLGENVLEHWVIARGKEPTREEREGFRLLALHRQGADKEPSFNACRETCRELVYHYNLLTLQADDPKSGEHAAMMAWVARHLLLFVMGKMETGKLGEFCCASRPLRDGVDEKMAAQ